MEHLNYVLQNLSKRAERNPFSVLKSTFVDVAGVTKSTSNRDHKIFFGRRGTGKTHALIYQFEHIASRGELPVYIDLRQMGSDRSVYDDAKEPVSQRASRFTADFVSEICEGITKSKADGRSRFQLADGAEEINELLQSANNIQIVGIAEAVDSSEHKKSKRRTSKMGLTSALEGALDHERVDEEDNSRHNSLRRSGQEQFRVHFRTLMRSLEAVAKALDTTIWLLVDEWSSIPHDVQPYFADVLRRSIFPIKSCVVHIAAIEHRSSFRLPLPADYVGIELGADASSAINLDDYMVFENNPDESIDFFASLLRHHTNSLIEDPNRQFADNKSFVASAFVSKGAFDEFVRACEGVPRDAISICGKAAQKSGLKKISVQSVKRAARDWFEQDKSKFLRDNREADFFLRWVIDDVIGERKARAFLVSTESISNVLNALYDHRLIHLIKRSISSKDEPGRRYMAYKLDYGCYIDLMTTKRAPQGLLPTEDRSGKPSYVEVPKDDYRAIRRAVLDVSEFDYSILERELASRKLPVGPLSMAFKIDLKLQDIMKSLLRSDRNNDDTQLDLFSKPKND